MKKKRILLLGVLLASSLMTLFAQFSADKTYTICNNNDASVFIKDNGSGTLATGALNYYSYWKFVPTGNTDCYYIQNAITGLYVQGYSETEKEVATGATGVEYYVKADTDGSYAGKYRMSCAANNPHDFSDGTLGLNWKANGTVQSFASVAGGNARSAWTVTEAEQPSAPALTSPYAGNAIAAGDFFIYNVETGLWLQNNDKNTGDWNTRGATGTYGFDFAITSVSGGWKLDPRFGNNHSLNSSNFYLDTNDDVTTWVFEPKTVDGVTNAYIIKSGGVILGVDASDNLAKTTNNSTWQIITRQQRIDYLKDNATQESPLDATFLIQDPGFANANERASSWTWNRNGGNLDDNRYFRNRRSYAVWNSTSFTLAQTINNVPNGYYKLNVKGYYRDGNKDDVANRRTAGTENLIGKYYINNDKASLMSILDGASDTWIEGRFYYPAADASHPYGFYPDNADAFNRIFQEYPNSYMNAGIQSTVTDKTIRIGLEKTTANANDWLAWDEFYLTYLGPIDLTEYLAGLNSAIQAAGEYDSSTTTDALRNALNTALNNANNALTSEDPDELSDVTAALNTALSNAKAVDITFLSNTISLASADGVDTSAAENFIANGTDAATGTSLLNSLRIARRVANAETQEDVFEGQIPAAGHFYLYNVGQQRFFCGGDDWGAHAALGFPGIIVTLETVSDGVYRINTHLQNGKDGDKNKEYLNYGGYCDTWNADETSWKFISLGDGKYTIARNSDNNLLLGYSTGTYNRLDTDKSGGDNPDNQWKLVTKADRDAILATATEEAPQDASYLIKSPGFSQREDVSAWTLTGDASIWGRGSNHPDFAIEAYDKTAASVEQTVTGLPAGTYELRVQAFYRDGNFDKQAEILAGGGDARQLATLYAGTKSALIQNVSGGADKAPGMGKSSAAGYMPDGIDDACLYFQSGLYWASLDEIVVGQDGTMTIGARKTEKINDGDWMVLDNFRLIYKGAGVDLSGVKADLLAKIGEANDLMDALDLRLSFLKTLAGNGQDVYDNSNDLDEIVNATNALQTAINQVNNVTNLTAFIQTADLATAEGIDVNDEKAAIEAVADGANVATVAGEQLYILRAARKVNALGKPDVYTGSAPAEGKVYLYNLGTGMFLGMGSDWSTHAAVDQVGIEVELVASGDDFIFKSAYGSFNNSPYVDTGANTVYKFTAVEGKENVYTISEGDDLLGWNPNGKTDGKKYWNSISNTSGASAADANFQWKVITAAERETLWAAANAENAVDVSYMIKNPSLDRKPGYDMWNKECNGGNGGARVNTTDDNNGDRAADYAWEYYEPNSFSFTQTVTGLKPGHYRVTVQGFYRDGNGDHQKGIVESDGVSANAAYLVAKDQQAWLPNISSVKDLVPGQDGLIETTKGSYPNWPRAAIEYFENGAYLTTVDAMVGANGELTIGVKKDTRPNAGDWVVLDNFRLTYLGTPLNINTMSIVGDFTGGWEFTNDKLMTMDANDPNIWTYVIEDFKAEARTYDYKVTANEQWGVYEKPSEFDPKNDSGNAEFTFGTEGYPAGHYRLVFTVNTSTHTMTLDVQKPTVTISENADNEVAAAEDALILLNRSFTNEGWNTFVVPFAISNADLKRAFGDEVKVAEYSEDSVDPQNVIVRFKKMEDGEDAVSANVPVLLQTNTTKTSFLFKSDIVEGTPKTEGTNYDFVGSYDASTTIPDGEFFLSGNKIYKSEGNTTLKGTRAYFQAKTAGARIVTLLFDNEGMTTAISENFKVKSEKPATIYDLLGRKLSTVKKGVYIVDGKKVVK